MSAVPAQWAAIARSGDAEERRLLALSRWNRDFLDLIPGYAAALRTKLVDVRVCALSGESLVLLYFFDESDPTYSMTIGADLLGDDSRARTHISSRGACRLHAQRRLGSVRNYRAAQHDDSCRGVGEPGRDPWLVRQLVGGLRADRFTPTPLHHPLHTRLHALDIAGFAAGPSAHLLRRGDQC